MRPRFSLRVILVVVALVAGTIYFGCVRPTMVAERFVAAVMRRDFVAASQLAGDDRWQAVVQPNGSRADWVYAELVPRERTDWWRCERHIILRVSRHSDHDGGYRDWTEDTDVVAGPAGVRIPEQWRTINFAGPVPAPTIDRSAANDR